MEEMSLSEVAEAVGGKLIAGSGETVISGVSTDSRRISGGELFVALRGPNFDGHEFAERALEEGASAAMVEKELSVTAEKGLVLVADSVTALGDLAAAYRRRFPPLKVIGVTGSNGKTTTKDMIARILAGFGETVSAEKSFNNFIGVPLTVFELMNGDSYGVFELGTSARGEIERLAEICAPEIGVVTNVSRTHLEGLGSEEEVFEAKAELLEALPEEGTAVLNYDDKWCRKMGSDFKGRILWFGLSPEAGVRGEEVEATDDGISFLVSGAGRVELRMLGRWNVYNALAAVAAGSAVGIAPDEALRGLTGFRPQGMRMELEVVAGVRVINDAYNANPASVAAALEEVVRRRGAGKAIMVVGDMLELGEESERLHMEMGEKAAEVEVNVLIGVGEEVKGACDAARRRGVAAWCFEDWRDALERVIELTEPGDVVLVKGSRAMRLERLVEEYKKRRSE